MNIRFTCPECDHPGQWDASASNDWHCPSCDHQLYLASAPTDKDLRACAVCGNAELYRKKNFPHWLGMTLLAAACVAFLVTNFFYQQWLAWGILLGSALIDGLLYLAVGDVVVCYRCGAEHRGALGNSRHQPFELSVGERYRQEQLRHEQLRAGKNA